MRDIDTENALTDKSGLYVSEEGIMRRIRSIVKVASLALGIRGIEMQKHIINSSNIKIKSVLRH